MRLFAFPLLLLAAAPVLAQGRLEPEWFRRLDFQTGAVQSWAVCPDGGFRAGDRSGTVVLLDSAGAVARRQEKVRALAGARLLACDAAGRLWVTPGEGIDIVEMPPGGSWGVTSRIAAGVRPEQIVFGEDGLTYVLGRRAGRFQPIHILDAAGRVVHSFGGPVPRTVPYRAEGSLLWNGAAGRLIHVLPYEFRIYDPEGRLLGARAPAWRNPLQPVQYGDAVTLEVLGAAQLPDGGILVASRNMGRDRPPFALDLYRPDLDFIRSFYGSASRLAGAAADGSLYFASVLPRELRVFKARFR
jgi:hypothetical protein